MVVPAPQLAVYIHAGIWCAEQDSVRLLTVESCGPLARLLNKDDAVRSILPIVQTFSQVPNLYTEQWSRVKSCSFVLLHARLCKQTLQLDTSIAHS